MGWKGTVRSVNSTLKALDREAQRRNRERNREAIRRQREMEKNAKAHAKLQELERARFEVEDYEEEINRFKSLHALGTTVSIDWNEIATLEPPSEPVHTSIHKRLAEGELHKYKPSILDKTLKRAEKKKKLLKQAVEEADKEDLLEYQESLIQFSKDKLDWEHSISFANRILDHDTTSYVEALDELKPFSSVSELFKMVEFQAYSKNSVAASCKIDLENTVPSIRKSLLQSGKISVKQMPKSQYFELCQDFVCSCALRIARDLLGILPVEWIMVNICMEMLNSATGMLQDQVILSVAIPRTTLSKIKLKAVDPSDAMSNFKHQMQFKKTKGFSGVEVLSLLDFTND